MTEEIKKGPPIMSLEEIRQAEGIPIERLSITDQILVYWSEILIVILAITLAFILGRGYESRLVQKIAAERDYYLALKLKTEQALNRDGTSTTLQQAFKDLGFDGVKVSEKTPEKK